MTIDDLGKQLLITGAFSALGIAVMAVAFYVWEMITPYSIHEEISEKQNIAVAIIMAGILIGISIIIAGALLG